MRSVWVCIPTAQKKHVPGILKKWGAKGYNIALFVDVGPVDLGDSPVAMLVMAPYPGVWRAWNALAKAVMAVGADVVVLAGDDMEPDEKLDAQQIAEQYFERFPAGDGVMQPCGDPQGEVIDGLHNAGRICGSPWLGRSWVIYAYGGEGPVNGRYVAFYADEELKIVAEKLGVLWMRPDLTQKHLHWSWGHLPKQKYHERNQLSWEADKARFEEEKASGFSHGMEDVE